MDKSKFLSKAFGLYFIILSTALLLHMKSMSSIMSGFNDPSLLFIVGIITMIMGLLLVLNHNVWEWSWRVIITIISWLVLLKGISIIFFPQYMMKLTNLFIQDHNFQLIGLGIDLILGLFLTYMGFRHKKLNEMMK